jgi:TRAP transporter 4TM/12TM fusion protein
MPAIWPTIRSGLAAVFKPELKTRRQLHEGMTPANLGLLGVVTVAILLLAVFLTGQTFTLYLPHYFDWKWVDVTILRFPVWMWLAFWFVAAGLCLRPRLTVIAIGVAFSLYYLYAAVNGATIHVPFSGMDLVSLPYLRIFSYHHYLPLFIAFSGVLLFVYYPASARSPKDRPSAIDIVLCLLTLASTFDYMWNFAERGEREGLVHWNDVVFGAIMIVVSLEMCRRILGLILPLLGALFFAYCWFGNYVPGALSHSGFSINELIAYMYSQSAIYGQIAGVFATYVFPFIVFGTVLQSTKIGDVFVDIAFSLVGRYPGGAAKSAVVSSGLVGSIIGSGAANIAVTGVFTIPLMKRSGYRPHYAAGVEAVASIGGQLMPPIMGSAAFLVAAFTETDYAYVALVSLVPALMYFYSLYMQVHFRACAVGIKGLPREELPSFRQVMRKDGYRLLPVALLILLLILRFSPFYAAFWSICFALAISCLREETRQLQLPNPIARLIGWGGQPKAGDGERVHSGLLADWGGIAAGVLVLVGLSAGFGMEIENALFFAICAIILFSSARLIYTLADGAVASLVLNATAGIMGIVLAGVTLPGLALRFPAIMLEFADGSLPVLILLCAIASYIMGMGMTITASYVILAILAVPALVQLGVPELNAHLIILWLSQDAALTPPFALGAFIAAGIAGADPTRTGYTSVLLAKPLYIVPFLMAYSPILMDPGSAWWDIAIVWVTGFVGFYCLAAGMEGYFRRRLSWPERLLFVTAAVCFFFQFWWIKVAAVALLALCVALQTWIRPAETVVPQIKPGE